MTHGKHTDKYWQKRLSTRGASSTFYARISWQGKERWWRLDTSDRGEGAKKARDIWMSLQAVGLEPTLLQYAPRTHLTPEASGATLGEWLAAVRPIMLGGRTSKNTFDGYAVVARRIVADFMTPRPNPRADDWEAKTGAFPLAQWTPERFKEWLRKEIDKVADNPAALASKKRSLNTYLVQCKALFHPDLARELPDFKLPRPLPCDGIPYFDRGSVRYFSKVDGRILLTAAKNDLSVDNPQAYKVLLLALCAGLRRGEIDWLEWKMVDLGRERICLVETEWLHLKSAASMDAVDIEPEVAAELRGLMAKSTSRFVVDGLKPEDVKPKTYRCEKAFSELKTWLKAHGITDRKPIHTLRKECGALTVTAGGIYAGSRKLRHANLQTTAAHYADQKERVSVGFGRVLSGSSPVVAEPNSQTQDTQRDTGTGLATQSLAG